MIQQLLALAIIIFFVVRLIKQKSKKKISPNEFTFWLIFWIISAIAIIFLKNLDQLLATIGFSGSGINFLLYLAVIILFYFIFKLRLKIIDLEKSITELARKMALKDL